MAAGDGLIVMQPTSIVVAGAGSSASINADGGVDFDAVTELSLNGVFTASHDNYLVVVRFTSSGATSVDMRLRAAGTDNSTASSYVAQYIQANGTTVSGARQTSNIRLDVLTPLATQRCGANMHFYGPYLAQPTAMRVVTVLDRSSAEIVDQAHTHNQSTAYDGFTIFRDTSPQTLTGNIVVFGYEE